MTGVRFAETSFGVGTLVRFKSFKSQSWTYAIYRGTGEHDGRSVGFEFSDTPLGPITRWLGYWPEFMEAALPIVPGGTP